LGRGEIRRLREGDGCSRPGAAAAAFSKSGVCGWREGARGNRAVVDLSRSSSALIGKVHQPTGVVHSFSFSFFLTRRLVWVNKMVQEFDRFYVDQIL
jgi:hypothetical protein